MAEDSNGTMNFDLNLGPLDNSSDDGEPGLGYHPNIAMNLEDWLDSPSYTVRDVVTHRAQRLRSMWRQVSIPPETQNFALELIGGNASQTGEASVGPDERPTEDVVKKCENCEEDKSLGRQKDAQKYNGDEGSFFDCNICLDLARDPVVTCCGHLFCWPCLYRWLHHHSDAKECPVCKGEVTVKTVTPVYGRGNNKRELDLDANLKIPERPQGRRVESWRQTIQRSAYAIPMEEMIRRLGSTYDFSRELSQIRSRDPEAPPRGSPERGISLLNRILTSRAIRRERAPTAHTNDDINLTETGPTNYEERDIRLSSRLLRRSNSHRAASLSNLTSAINSADSLVAERLVESYSHHNHLDRNQEVLTPVDDRGSVSSIAAVIHSESQTVDNTIEIDSTGSRSTLSSSRRRNDVSRISDLDSGDSRASRRRRLN